MAKAVTISASALVKNAGGLCWGFMIDSANAGTVKIWDGLTAAGRVLVDTTTAISAPFNGRFACGVEFQTGLFVTIGGTAATVTVFFE